MRKTAAACSSRFSSSRTKSLGSLGLIICAFIKLSATFRELKGGCTVVQIDEAPADLIRNMSCNCADDYTTEVPPILARSTGPRDMFATCWHGEECRAPQIGLLSTGFEVHWAALFMVVDRKVHVRKFK